MSERKTHKARTHKARAYVGKTVDEVRAANKALYQSIGGKHTEIAERIWAQIADRPVPKAQGKTMLRDLFGIWHKDPDTGRRVKTVDTAAAADALGVHRRTVQRWLKDGMPKGKSEAAEKLREEWTGSKHARARQISPARRQRLTNTVTGLSVAMKGVFVVSESDEWSAGVRDANVADFSDEQRKAMLDSFLNGDPEGAYDALVDGVRDGFGGSEHLAIDLNSLKFGW